MNLHNAILAAWSLLACTFLAATGCATQSTQEKQKPKISHYEAEMVRIGNTHCRQLAARMAAIELDREFGGYDPAEYPANLRKVSMWVEECRPLLREVWEWEYLNITKNLEGIKDEKVFHEAAGQYFERNKAKLIELRKMEQKLLTDSGLVEKYR